MSERPKEDVILKLKGLLSKTIENGCTQAEAEAAFRLASRLMAEHNIAMADVEAKGTETESFVEIDAFDASRWTLEMNLAYGICNRYFFVEALLTHRTVKSNPVYYNGKPVYEEKDRKFLRFFGTPTNVEAAKFTFSALLNAFDRLFDEYRNHSGCSSADRRLFISGVAQGFADKLRDERRAMEIERDLRPGKASGETAIVLKSVADRTLAAYKQAHPNVKQGRGNFSGLTGSESTLKAGYEAGRKLNLNRAVGASSGSGRKGIGA